MKANEEKVIYFTDELNEDFSETELKHEPVDKNYVYYSRNPFWKIGHFFWNKIVAYPISIIHAKCRFGWRIVNKKAFKSVKNSSYFVFGNHTQQFFDATMAKMISNKDCYVIVNPDNLNIKGLGWLVKKLGALPLPNDVHTTKRFVNALNQLVEDKRPVLIYPEAHIWPYYTKIRPFKETSFRYPVKYDVPSFCFTNTYQKKGKKIHIVTYVDGPFYPDENLPTKERELDLRNRIYETMVERSQNSNVEVIKYKRKEGNSD